MADFVDTVKGVVPLQPLKVANCAVFFCVALFSGLAGGGALGNASVADAAGDLKFTPDGTAFTIWGIIYTFDALFALYSFWWPTEDESFLHSVAILFLFTCVFNVLWICTFVQNNDASIWFSTLLLAALLVCVIKIQTLVYCSGRPRTQLTKHGIIAAIVVDVHFSIYAGWATVATIANITLAFSTFSSPGGDAASAWCFVVLLVALAIVSFITVTRRDCAYGFVLSWASGFIIVGNQADAEVGSGDDEVVITAATLVCIAITFISFAVGAHTAYTWLNGDQASPQTIDAEAAPRDVYVDIDKDRALHPL
jgi:tryptophan-rich sensory protein